MTVLARLRILDTAERREREHARRFAAVIRAQLNAERASVPR